MENVKIISDNGVEIDVNGIFYVFNSKYYFIYTTGEIDENEYIKLYVVQVCKEVQNTPSGPVDTGYMLGMEILNPEEWVKVQESITKIVEDKKNNTQSVEIQYLPISMIVNLKIVGKNKFKLMKHIVENDFGVRILSSVTEDTNANMTFNKDNNVDSSVNLGNEVNPGEIIIDYRARFFEEQEKNQQLNEQIKLLNEKLANIKNIIE